MDEPTGWQRPRLWSFPAYATSAAEDAIGVGVTAGVELDEWQQWFLYPALGERAQDGKWAARQVCLICSRQNGKNGTVEVRELAGLFGGFREELIIHTAHQFKTCHESYLRTLALIEGVPEFDRRVAATPRSHGEEGILLKPTPAYIGPTSSVKITRSIQPRLRFLARSATSARGFSCDLLVYDEAMVLDADDVGASFPAMSARNRKTPGGWQVWYLASAGMRISTQLAKVRARALAPLEVLNVERDEGKLAALLEEFAKTLPGLAEAPYARPMPGAAARLAFAEWSILPHEDRCERNCDAHDNPYEITSYAKANPGFPHRVDLETIEEERDTLGTEQFLRERLGVGTYPVPGDAWLILPKAWWEVTTMTNQQRAHRPARRVCSIDTTPNRAWTSIALAGPGLDGRVQLELAFHEPGTSWVVDECVRIQERWGVEGWVVDRRGQAASFITELEEAGLTVYALAGPEVGVACGGLYDAYRDGALEGPKPLMHDGNEHVRRGLAGGRWRKSGESRVFDRDQVVGDLALDLSGLYAYALAHHGWVTYGAGADYDARQSVAFDTAELLRLYQAGVYGPHDVERIWARGLLSDNDLKLLARNNVLLPAGALNGND